MSSTTCQAAVVITKGLIRCPNQAVDNRFCKHHVEKFAAQEKTA